MTKMLKIQKIPNLVLLISRDDQLAYFTMLTPKSKMKQNSQKIQS